MKHIILLSFCVVFYAGQIFGSEFDAELLPMAHNISSINSTAIQLFWKPSSSLVNVDIAKLHGIFTVGLYCASHYTTLSNIIIDDIDQLNSSDVITRGQLEPNTVYSTCFLSKWYPLNNSGIDDQASGIYRRQCQLLRTYDSDETTLRPIPSIGTYTWKQTFNSTTGKKAILVNTTISSELPSISRNITVMLESLKQMKVIQIPTETAEFTFSDLDAKSKNYQLTITFEIVDLYKITTYKNTISTIIVTNATDTDGNPNGSLKHVGSFAYSCFFPMIFVLFIYL